MDEQEVVTTEEVADEATEEVVSDDTVETEA